MAEVIFTFQVRGVKISFNNRQYDPQIGRFLSVDPLAPETDAFAPYAAMNNDPASLTDPGGLKVEESLTIISRTTQANYSQNAFSHYFIQ